MYESSGIVLYGAGGHGKVISDIAKASGKAVAFFVDNDPHKTIFHGIEVVHETQAAAVLTANHLVLLTIGSNAARKRLATLFAAFATAIHPRANLAEDVQLGEGSVVMAGATINPATSIGRHCIINTNASVDHDCVVEDFVHISPGATLCGGVQVGEGTHVGAGAVIIPGIQIGRWCTIGAGTVVIKNIPDGCTVVGNPGRIIKQKEIHA